MTHEKRLKVWNNRNNWSALRSSHTNISVCVWLSFHFTLSLSAADRLLINEQSEHVLINHLTNPILNYRPEKLFGRHFPGAWRWMGGGEWRRPKTLVTDTLLPEHWAVSVQPSAFSQLTAFHLQGHMQLKSMFNISPIHPYQVQQRQKRCLQVFLMMILSLSGHVLIFLPNKHFPVFMMLPWTRPERHVSSQITALKHNFVTLCTDLGEIGSYFCQNYLDRYLTVKLC